MGENKEKKKPFGGISNLELTEAFARSLGEAITENIRKETKDLEISLEDISCPLCGESVVLDRDVDGFELCGHFVCKKCKVGFNIFGLLEKEEEILKD